LTLTLLIPVSCSGLSLLKVWINLVNCIYFIMTLFINPLYMTTKLVSALIKTLLLFTWTYMIHLNCVLSNIIGYSPHITACIISLTACALIISGKTVPVGSSLLRPSLTRSTLILWTFVIDYLIHGCTWLLLKGHIKHVGSADLCSPKGFSLCFHIFVDLYRS
jgi:hypothetical protein